MSKIIRLDSSRKPLSRQPSGTTACEHRNVIAYTSCRTVQCTSCGTSLDPFDVLVDMIKGYLPPGGGQREEKRFDREVEKRQKEKEKDE